MTAILNRSQLLEEAAPHAEAEAAAGTVAGAAARAAAAAGSARADAPLDSPEEEGHEGGTRVGGGEEDERGHEGGDGEGEGEGGGGAVRLGGRRLQLRLVADHADEAVRRAGERRDAWRREGGRCKRERRVTTH